MADKITSTEIIEAGKRHAKSVRIGGRDFDMPVKNNIVRLQIVKQDQCPECGGELDTGWECNDCGFDAEPLIKGRSIANEGKTDV